MIIYDFFYILKITVDIHATKGERTLKNFQVTQLLSEPVSECNLRYNLSADEKNL